MFSYIGIHYDKVTVTAGGILVAKLTPDDAVKAVCLQYGLLYVYNMDWVHTNRGQTTPKSTRHYFSCISRIVFGILPKEVSTKTGVVQKRSIEREVKIFETAFKDFREKNCV